MRREQDTQTVDPPKVSPPTGLRRHAQRAGFWGTVAWNLWGPNRWRSIFVVGYPRTGTNWFARIMSHYFEVPRHMPGHQMLPVIHPVVLHTHRFAVAPRRAIYLVRDPRDVVVSFYHKAIKTNRAALRQRISRHLPHPFEHEHLRANLADFTRLTYAEDVGGAIPFDQHIREAQKRGLYSVRYEDVLERGEAAVGGAVAHLTGGEADPEQVRKALEETSFEKKTGRQRGQEDLRWASVRKGIAGDWKNHFTRESAQAFQRCDPDSLVTLGYERDDSWVDSLPDAGDPSE